MQVTVFRKTIFLILVAGTLLVSSCAPLYQRQLQVTQNIQEGEYEKALKLLEKDKFYQLSRNEVLYNLEMGRLLGLHGDLEGSNRHLEKAYLMIEDYQKNYPLEALSMFINDNIKPYRAEDFEKLVAHYFMGMNYIEMGQIEEALVEVRRIHLDLQQLNDKYQEHKNKYSDDAFAKIFEGLLYEKAGDINNAFISYRNAVELFFKDGQETDYFGTFLPGQLRSDVLRTAHLMGFQDELSRLETLLGVDYEPQPPPPGGELVVFWENGLGPVKDQWSLNFTIIQGKHADQIIFVNEQFGIFIPIFHSDREERNKMLSLQIIRLVLPKYVGRPHLFNDGLVNINGQDVPFEMGINYNIIARQCLRDRFFREASKALIRVALKELEEYELRKQNETAGIILGVINAATEQADTRSWQSIPSDIRYARLPLQKGANKVSLRFYGHGGQAETRELTIEGNGKLNFIRMATPLAEGGLIDLGFAGSNGR